ncbi:MAG TPA: hypothetical protein VHL80_13125 [Polyangia bacterium]|nr:hypothetical protein [Polyangia bacterium]
MFMAKAAKSRASGKAARKSGRAKAKPRKKASAAKQSVKKARKVPSKAKKAGASAKARAAAKPKAPERPGGTPTTVRDGAGLVSAAQPIAAGAVATMLPRPEAKSVPSRGAPRAESEAGESESPPALPVPIASFTF